MSVEDISAELKVLGLPSDTIPSLSVVKKAIRENYLNKHPDNTELRVGTEKANQPSVSAFQEVNEAAQKVYAFLADRQDVGTDRCF